MGPRVVTASLTKSAAEYRVAKRAGPRPGEFQDEWFDEPDELGLG